MGGLFMTLFYHINNTLVYDTQITSNLDGVLKQQTFHWTGPHRVGYITIYHERDISPICELEFIWKPETIFTKGI
jgi:hypothetical protein